MKTDTSLELRASPLPTSRPSSSLRRVRSASASSPAATDSVNPNPDLWEGKVSALLQVFVVHLRILQNQEYNTKCYTSQRAPEMVPTRPAAPEMVPRPAAVGEAPSPDGRVLSDLASSWLAYGAVVALRPSARGLAHRSVGYTYESSRQIRVVSGLLVRAS